MELKEPTVMRARYCFAIDLTDDKERQLEYRKHHERVWPEVEDSFRRAGIEAIELYISGNRLFMLLDVNDTFSFEKKNEIDSSDPVVRKWEELMGSYQLPLPWSAPGQKWVLMEKLYQFRG